MSTASAREAAGLGGDDGGIRRANWDAKRGGQATGGLSELGRDRVPMNRAISPVSGADWGS